MIKKYGIYERIPYFLYCRFDGKNIYYRFKICNIFFVSENTISRIYLINRGNVGGWMNVEKLSLVIEKLVKNRDMIKNNRTISQNLYLVMKNVLHRL